MDSDPNRASGIFKGRNSQDETSSAQSYDDRNAMSNMRPEDSVQEGAASTAQSPSQSQNQFVVQQPAAMRSDAQEQPETIESHEESQPTASHELADAATEKPLEEKGYAEVDHGDVEVKNLGWNSKQPNDVPNPLVGGLTNYDLWLLVRRFNQQVFHVKSIPNAPMGDLDLNIADDEVFTPEKLRAHVERLYMTVIVGVFALWKHIVRLRSWREYRRTSTYLTVYAIAWLFDILVPVLCTFLVVLILFPESRPYCFPNAPPALIDHHTGGVKKPASGVLASEDSVTGAPETYPGEAVEQEAHNFVSSISTLIVSTAAGKHPQGDPPSPDNVNVPDPADVTQDVVNAKDKSDGYKPGHEHDKTMKPVSQSVWNKARPAMHVIADFVDTWERFGNALSPTAPFPMLEPKLKLIGLLAPMILGSFCVSSYMLVKGFGFVVGFLFFGDPIIQWLLKFINRRIPHWEKYIELRNTVLKGIPTNAQLTITLLRIGERNKAPLPPPPTSSAPPAPEATETTGEDLDHLGIDQGEIEEAMEPDEAALAPAESATPEHKQKKGHRIVNAIKSVAKSGVNSSLVANKMKAQVGSHHAKDKVGVVKKLQHQDPPKGPVRFPARYKGKKGHAYITATATTPALSWTEDSEDVAPVWSVTIGEIQELQKVGGLGWKSKIFVGWATQRAIADGLIVKDGKGVEHHLTAILTRDELFNRLVAMGTQMWEAW